MVQLFVAQSRKFHILITLHYGVDYNLMKSFVESQVFLIY